MTAATAVGYVEMRIAKAVGLATAEDQPLYYVVLEEVAGNRQLAIAIGQPEAFSLAARLGGMRWRRPMTYQFVAVMVQALGRRSGRRSSISWWRMPMSPPSRWKGRLVGGRSTRGPTTR
jgi:hypothetical protein